MRAKNKLIRGVGINDADYPVTKYDISKGRSRQVWMCPIYQVWAHMLDRCYSPASHAKHPTYIECSVVPEWLKFSAFRSWMNGLAWEEKEIDKDILFPGNKTYGPEFCVFISRELNLFICDARKARGEWPIGVTWSKNEQKFKSQCNNPFTGERGHIGTFSCSLEAHNEWRKRKHSYALVYAAIQGDPRVAAALRIRYLPENLHKIGI